MFFFALYIFLGGRVCCPWPTGLHWHGEGSHRAEVRDLPEPSLRPVLASDWSAVPSPASHWSILSCQSRSRDESSLGPRSWERPRWGQSSGYIRHPPTQDICQGLFGGNNIIKGKKKILAQCAGNMQKVQNWIRHSDMTIQSNRLLKILVIYFDATPRQQTLQTDINSFTHRTLLTVGDNRNYVNTLLVMGLINLKVAHLYKTDFRKRARRQTNK